MAVIAVTAWFSPVTAQAQNLVSNADFETGPFGVNNTVTSWTVTGSAVVTVAEEGATTPTHSATFKPKGGVLSQTLTTTAGQTYDVDFDAGGFGHILKSTVLFVVQQDDALIESYGEIGRPIVVIVACGTANRVQRWVEPRLRRHVFELAFA